MSITNGPNLGLMVNGNQGEAHYSQFMGLLRGLDGLVMPSVKGYLTNTPPGSPADGDCYIIGAAPTGTWAGQGGKVTRYFTVAAAWEYYTPKNGWTLEASSARESYRYTAGAWEIYYQEGTWTPTLAGLTTAGSHTYSVRSGTYLRIGRAVFITGELALSAKDAAMAGEVVVTGLPFVPTERSVGSMTFDLIALGASYSTIQPRVEVSSYIRFIKGGNNIGANLTNPSDIVNTSAMVFSCNYKV